MHIYFRCVFVLRPTSVRITQHKMSRNIQDIYSFPRWSVIRNHLHLRLCDNIINAYLTSNEKSKYQVILKYCLIIVSSSLGPLLLCGGISHCFTSFSSWSQKMFELDTEHKCLNKSLGCFLVGCLTDLSCVHQVAKADAHPEPWLCSQEDYQCCSHRPGPPPAAQEHVLPRCPQEVSFFVCSMFPFWTSLPLRSSC